MQRNEAGTYQFDLKETVHLSQQQLPIEEIEELELIPQIEIEEKGEEIDISGSLYLHGNYRGNLNAGKLETVEDPPNSYQESVQFEPLSVERGPFSPLAKEDKFEYRIPVRISLPKGKVRDVSDVYAFIGSFDYELKNPYQIEIMASLVITGFKEQEEDSLEDSLELMQEFIQQEPLFTSPMEFVHVAGESFTQPADDVMEQRLQALEEQIAGLEEQPTVLAFPEFRNVENQEESNQTITEPYIELEDEAETMLEQTWTTEEEVPVLTEAPVEELNNVIPMPNLVEHEEVASPPEAFEMPDQEVKVAISKKGTKKDREKITSISSIFSRPPRIEEKIDEQSAESKEIENANNEALYLTNFMGEKEERFTKFKLCIIQKDETIEEIADRYRLQVETILRANQTNRSQVSAGQILYIPVKG